jgi:hypothetical protein
MLPLYFTVNLPRMLQKIRFRLRLITDPFRAQWRLTRTLLFKECYYGPFKGEFGHLLGHNLPFIAYLHSKGVKIHFCGMELYKPFLVDEEGKSLVVEYAGLRDFFRETKLDSNKAEEPLDVKEVTDNFIKRATLSVRPYWDLNDETFYWYTFRWWTIKNKYAKTYDLSKVYKTASENSVVIFPRNKGAAFHINNGETWDYKEVADTVKSLFDKVYIIGHPAFSQPMNSYENVEVLVSNDNSVLLEKCCNSKLIITQHSGTVYLGEYTNTPVLIIYKGGKSIGNIEETKKFKDALGKKYDFNYAFSLPEIVNFIKKLK